MTRNPEPEQQYLDGNIRSWTVRANNLILAADEQIEIAAFILLEGKFPPIAKDVSPDGITLTYKRMAEANSVGHRIDDIITALETA